MVSRDCSGKIILKNEDIDDSLYANWLFDTDIELIEDEIDIDSIKEMELDAIDDVTYYINDLIKAVKQIDKRVKKLEER